MLSRVSNHSPYRHSLVLLFLLLALLAACAQSSPTTTTGSSQSSPTPPVVNDYYGTPIAFPTTAPRRIISLVPSASEILGALNLQNRVVGVDFYTAYPPTLAKLPKVSDVNGKYNNEQIELLKPDLVLSYGGLTKQYDRQLQSLGLHVVDLPIAANLEQVLRQVLVVGRLTFTQSAAQALVNSLQQQIDAVKKAVAGTTAPSVMMEIDDSTPGKPYVFGGGSYGDELLQDANGINIFHSDTNNGGYPQVTDEAVIAANPQFIILTEDPAYGGSPTLVYKRPNWDNIQAVKSRQVYRINVNITQQAGPRLVEGLRCLAQIIHPQSFTGALPAYCTGIV